MAIELCPKYQPFDSVFWLLRYFSIGEDVSVPVFALF